MKKIFTYPSFYLTIFRLYWLGKNSGRGDTIISLIEFPFFFKFSEEIGEISQRVIKRMRLGLRVDF